MIVGLIAASLLAGAGLGLAASESGGFNGTGTTVTQTPGGNSTSPYILTLIITTNNLFNSTIGDQPAFYVLGSSGLESSANITLPAHHLIELVISNYDDGNASLSGPQYASVSGTVSGTEMVFNNTNINSTQGSSGIELRGAQTVASLPTGDISHTFTVPSLSLNVPISTSSTVVAFFTTGSAGTLTWLCEANCGSGADGTGGAMITAGWMTGALTVG
jgi:hypothetical protein